MKNIELSKVKVKYEVLVNKMKIKEDEQIAMKEMYKKRLLKNEGKLSRRIIHETNYNH